MRKQFILIIRRRNNIVSKLQIMKSRDEFRFDVNLFSGQHNLFQATLFLTFLDDLSNIFYTINHEFLY
jgi:hypothetical protein